jgi:hypothetical protein
LCCISLCCFVLCCAVKMCVECGAARSLPFSLSLILPSLTSHSSTLFPSFLSCFLLHPSIHPSLPPSSLHPSFPPSHTARLRQRRIDSPSDEEVKHAESGEEAVTATSSSSSFGPTAVLYFAVLEASELKVCVCVNFVCTDVCVYYRVSECLCRVEVVV